MKKIGMKFRKVGEGEVPKARKTIFFHSCPWAGMGKPMLTVQGNVSNNGKHKRERAVRFQVCKNTVIPAKAGIQTKDVNSVFLAPTFAGVTGKSNLQTDCGSLPR